MMKKWAMFLVLLLWACLMVMAGAGMLMLRRRAYSK